jgi:hypothetical protein
MVDEQKLHDGASGSFRRLTFHPHDHPVADGHHARWLRFGHPLNDRIALLIRRHCAVGISFWRPDFHQALPTDPDGF